MKPFMLHHHSECAAICFVAIHRRILFVQLWPIHASSIESITLQDELIRNRRSAFVCCFVSYLTSRSSNRE